MVNVLSAPLNFSKSLIRFLTGSFAVCRTHARAPIDPKVLLPVHLQRQRPAPSSSNRHSSDRCGMYCKHPLGHAPFPVPNSMPTAVLFLLRMPDNRFVEKPIHARRAYKSVTFSHRR